MNAIPKCTACDCLPKRTTELPPQVNDRAPLNDLDHWRKAARFGREPLLRCPWCGSQFYARPS